MGFGLQDILPALQTEVSDPVVAGAFNGNPVATSHIYASSLTITTESLDTQLDTPPQSLKMGYEPLFGSTICPLDLEVVTHAHKYSNYNAQSNALSTQKSMMTMMQPVADDPISGPTITIDSGYPHWHPLSIYMSGNGNADPWTIFSFRALEYRIKNGVGTEPDACMEPDACIDPDACWVLEVTTCSEDLDQDYVGNPLEIFM